MAAAKKGAGRQADDQDVYDDMIERIAPEVLQRFKHAGQDYGETFRQLGLAGQYSDIHRKVGKLKRALWDGIELEREEPAEIAGDLIGHCLIIIKLIEEGEGS